MSLLETTLNTRDLGGHHTKDGKITIFNRIYRSDCPKDPSEKDINLLLSNKITTIIDLRTIKEIRENCFSKMEKFNYFNFPIQEGSEIPKSCEEVPKSYIQITNYKNMKNILEKIANAENGVLIFCSAGKDRTGVITAIIFMICGIVEEEIVKDYMVSKDCLTERFKIIKQKSPKTDINIFTPHECYMKDFIKMFNERYENINKYLENIGLSEIDGVKIVNKLLKEN